MSFHKSVAWKLTEEASSHLPSGPVDLLSLSEKRSTYNPYFLSLSICCFTKDIYQFTIEDLQMISWFFER